jgi:hypothetical protein
LEQLVLKVPLVPLDQLALHLPPELHRLPQDQC